MARSIVVDVRKAVVEGIRDAVNDKRVSVTYGWQGGDETRRRKEIFTARPRATHEPAALAAGATKRHEVMQFDISIMVSDPGKQPEEVDEDVMDLGQAVEEFVAESKGGNLGVFGLNWLVVSAFEMENRLMKTGAATLATYTVTYDARLT